jgi:hypothetical protein
VAPPTVTTSRVCELKPTVTTTTAEPPCACSACLRCYDPFGCEPISPCRPAKLELVLLVDKTGSSLAFPGVTNLQEWSTNLIRANATAYEVARLVEHSADRTTAFNSVTAQVIMWDWERAPLPDGSPYGSIPPTELNVNETDGGFAAFSDKVEAMIKAGVQPPLNQKTAIGWTSETVLDGLLQITPHRDTVRVMLLLTSGDTENTEAKEYYDDRLASFKAKAQGSGVHTCLYAMQTTDYIGSNPAKETEYKLRDILTGVHDPHPDVCHGNSTKAYNAQLQSPSELAAWIVTDPDGPLMSQHDATCKFEGCYCDAAR